ncbi:MAG: hypothetical protein CL927_02595 [Deltaproteobacteria bacterium]|nr:hypothetical protein [Deltaproteobacteria bacterium]HCH64682.1 hypothetical protein [Deltaproteobacteria bacterium]
MMRVVWPVAGVLWAAAIALPGCNKDKAEDTSESSATGSGSGSGSGGTTEPDDARLVHDSQFALTVENSPALVTRTSTADYTVEATQDELSGFIRYAEQDSTGAETCTAVLTIRPEVDEPNPHGDTGAPAPEPAPPCDGCTMWHYAHTDLAITSGECTFGSLTTALDQSIDLVNVSNRLVVYDEPATSSLLISIEDATGEPVTDVLNLTAAGTATFDGSILSGQNIDTAETPVHWRDCLSATSGITGILTPGTLALSHTLACPAGVDVGTRVVSVWERDLVFSQQITAGIMTTVDAVDLYLRTPDGCLAAVDLRPTSCLGASSNLCMSLEHTVATGGNHALLVVHRGCTAEGLEYSFDARVHQL